MCKAWGGVLSGQTCGTMRSYGYGGDVTRPAQCEESVQQFGGATREVLHRHMGMLCCKSAEARNLADQ